MIAALPTSVRFWRIPSDNGVVYAIWHLCIGENAPRVLLRNADMDKVAPMDAAYGSADKNGVGTHSAVTHSMT